jgi:hypothetical protein
MCPEEWNPCAASLSPTVAVIVETTTSSLPLPSQCLLVIKVSLHMAFDTWRVYFGLLFYLQVKVKDFFQLGCFCVALTVISSSVDFKSKL